jgi:hypothetical protein
MTLILSGTDGLSDIDGTASTPAIRGTDANTGIFFPAADTIAFAEGGAEVARFDASGNFLVGQTTPVTSGRGVTVNGNQQSFIVRNGVSDYNEIGVWAGASNDVKGQLVAVTPDNKVIVGARTNHPLVFNVNDTERARIDTSGNLLVGTTTSSGNGNLIAAGVYNNTTASGANVQVDNTGPGLLRRSTSSIQYKTQVESISPDLINNALKFRPVWYRSLCDGDRKDWSWYGLIAEEVAELDPRLVHWRQYETSVDAEGNTVQTKLDKPVAEGVMYDRIVVLALGKLQEQQAMIEELKAKVAALEAKG